MDLILSVLCLVAVTISNVRLTAGGHKGDPNGYSIPKGVDLFVSVSFSLVYEFAHSSCQTGCNTNAEAYVLSSFFSLTASVGFELLHDYDVVHRSITSIGPLTSGMSQRSSTQRGS